MANEINNAAANVADIIQLAQANVALALDSMLEKTDGRAFDEIERRVWHNLLTAREFIDAAAKDSLVAANALVDALHIDGEEI